MSGLERVEGAERHGDDQGGGDETGARRARSQEIGEPIRRRRLSVRSQAGGRVGRRRRGGGRDGGGLDPECDPRLEILGRAIEQVRGVVGQLTAAIGRRRRARHQSDARAGSRYDLLPARALGEVLVAIPELARAVEVGRKRRAIDHTQLERGQAAGACREDRLVADDAQGQAALADFQAQPTRERLRLRGGPRGPRSDGRPGRRAPSLASPER